MNKKQFDCVKMMREIRNDLNKKFSKMNSSQLINYLNKKVPRKSKSKVKTISH